MKKIINIIIIVIIGLNIHAQYAPPLMYFYSGNQQIFLMNDSSSANIIIRNMENYNLIVDNVLTLFNSENDTVWFDDDDDDDNIIIKSSKLKQITKDSIIHFIQVDTNDIMFFTYSKIKNSTSQIWLRNDLIVILKDNYDTSDISSIYSTFDIFEIIRDDSNEYVIRCKSENDIFQLSYLLFI